MPQIRCPSCKNVFTATEASRGTRLACPSCNQLCRIPTKKGAPQDSAEQQGVTSTPSPTPDPREEDFLDEVDEADDSDVTDSPAPRRRRVDAADDPEDDDDEIPMEVVSKGRRKKKRRVRQRDGDLDRVNLGLGLYYASILALLGGLVVEVGAFAAGMTGGVSALAGSKEGAMGGLGMALMLGFVAGTLINWVAPILGLIGSILCLWAPEASGARVFSLTSVALNGSAMLAGLTQAALYFIPGGALIGAGLLILAGLMTFIAWCMFMAFLRQLCLHMDEGPLGEEAMAVMLRGIAILVLAPIIFLLAFILAMLGCVGGLMLLGIVGGGLYGLFLFLKRQLDLIGSIRQVIASRF